MCMDLSDFEATSFCDRVKFSLFIFFHPEFNGYFFFSCRMPLIKTCAECASHISEADLLISCDKCRFPVHMTPCSQIPVDDIPTYLNSTLPLHFQCTDCISVTSESRDFKSKISKLEKKVEQLESIVSNAFSNFMITDQEGIKPEFFVCECCFSDEVLDKDVVTCKEGHIFCSECVKRSVEIAFGNGNLIFNCLTDCKSDFNLEKLQDLLSASLYNKIILRIQESEVKAANVSGICFCPYCEYAEVLPDGDNIFKCKACKKQSCRLCHKETHIPYRCRELEEKAETSARRNIEDTMSDALLRECYNCKKKFIKMDGCNKMTCSCGAIMCYICKQPITGYNHFSSNDYNAAQPTTSTDEGRCPLWSNINEIHRQAVINAATVAIASVEQDNPQLHFDQNQMLKGLH